MAWVVFLTVFLSVGSLLIGSQGIEDVTVFLELYTTDYELFCVVLREIRLPRTILALTVGGTLGLCGAVLQGLLRNPLAEPYILGVSSSAALGSVSVLYFGLAASFPIATSLGGIAGTVLATTVLLIISSKQHDTLTLILGGVAVNAVMGALTSLLLNLAPNPYAALEIIFWMFGSLADRGNQHLILALPFMFVGWCLLLSTGRCLDALTLGEDVAGTLGFNLKIIKILVICGCALSVGAAVSTAGVISFVGLIVPHVLRPFVSQSPRELLWVSWFGGAILLLIADIGVRLLNTHIELKIGVLTALVGAPFFFHMVYSQNKMRKFRD
jgi:iron complex transport system permease protein